MTAVLKMNIEELDTKFVENLKHDFAHAELEIRVHDQPDSTVVFSVEDFWQTIAQLNWSNEEDDASIIAPVIQILMQQPLAYIYRFADILSEKLWQLDTKDHAQVFLEDAEEEGYLSVDDFLYARCAVVANGRDYYEKIRQNPAEMPIDATFEPLLYVAISAYKRKTGKEFNALPAFNYETYSNKEGWKK